MHNLKTKKLKGVVIKLYLSNAYDMVNWIYIRMLMTRLGFKIYFIRWVMSCISNVSFLILINGVASPFLHLEKGLRKGLPLSPFLFLLVVEGSRLFLDAAKRTKFLKGLQISQVLYITHLLFVDDILMFCDWSRCDLDKSCNGLALFKRAIGMQANDQKSTLSCSNLEEEEIRYIVSRFPF